MYTGIIPTAGLMFVTNDGEAVESKYNTSPTTPGNWKSVVTILPNGLTVIFPSSGSFNEVITPKAFSTCPEFVVSTTVKTP
jgi:antibiotic biosynthesis monooxygenase (ABM) superfamily enzyme